MIPTNEQIERISGAFALLLRDLNQTTAEAADALDPGEVVSVSDGTLARALALSLKRGCESTEFTELVQCASAILELALTVA